MVKIWKVTECIRQAINCSLPLFKTFAEEYLEQAEEETDLPGLEPNPIFPQHPVVQLLKWPPTLSYEDREAARGLNQVQELNFL